MKQEINFNKIIKRRIKIDPTGQELIQSCMEEAVRQALQLAAENVEPLITHTEHGKVCGVKKDLILDVQKLIVK